MAVIKVQNNDGKGNPYREDTNGRFTTPEGGGGSSEQTKEQEQVVKKTENGAPASKWLLGGKKATSDYEDIVNNALSNPYSICRKRENARSFGFRNDGLGYKTISGRYQEAKKFFYECSKDAWDTATFYEKEAVLSYTAGSGAFNRPLAGYKGHWGNFLGVGNVPLNNELEEHGIKNLTNIINRSPLKEDAWVQSGQYFQMLESIFGLEKNSVSQMTNEDLQSLIGKEGLCTTFISTSVVKDGGFTGSVDMIFNIYLPKGSRLLFLNGNSAFGHNEQEAIAQRGATYRLTRIERNSTTNKLYADIELVIEKGYDLDYGKYENSGGITNG